MDSTIRKQAQPIAKKPKKKQGKDELDRIKQAEKKKRRLEKAIATSAAIRAELEKKKQKKKDGLQEANEESLAEAAKKKQEKDEIERIRQAEKKTMRMEKAIATSAAIRAELENKKQKKLEEQRRLDEEGAAIAEAVALHVLLGEDCDDSYRIMLNEETAFNPWDYAANFNRFNSGSNGYFPQRRCASYAVQGMGFAANSKGLRDSKWSVSYEPFKRDAFEVYTNGGGWDNNNMGISAGLMAAQAVSSLQISENVNGVHGMLR